MQILLRRLICPWLGLALCGPVLADDLPPALTSVAVSNAQKTVTFSLYPGAEQYKILQANQLSQAFLEDPSGTFWGNTWMTPMGGAPSGFYQLEVVPIDKNVLLSTTVLNRLAYGPTPDELERVTTMGPDAYIAEQLAPELIQENLDFDQVPTNSGWQQYTATGPGSSSILYVYLNSTLAGEGYLDDVTLVAGTNAGVGQNLLINGDFESPLSTNDWTLSGNLASSIVTTEAAHSGSSSLKLVSSEPGGSQSLSIWQKISPSLSGSKPYTLSFWFLRSPTKPSSVTVRLSNSAISATSGGSLFAQLTANEASIDTLRSWHVLRAVESKRQLLEILLQFFENHFVTEYSKSADFFSLYDNAVPGRLATQLEFRENTRWRQALLNPQCTFYDLLKISAESPAMIIYLDTVTSRGDGNPPQTANENYARELLELFNFGVDNGYDQNDIVEISKCWTGWRVHMVADADQLNPLAPRLAQLYPTVPATNLLGTWAFTFQPEYHNTNSKAIFPAKVVPNRFGPPYAGRNYELDVPARTGTNGIQDGYDLIAHLANQPFTQEFISVKLCRVFVHDDFAIGYDFTDPNLSPEGQLVRQCMNAWENSSPKGQIRAVLATIFHSDLFRGNGASMQKVKTPLEYTVSTIRALRAQNPDGTYTVQTDGNVGAAGSILDRMGGMLLFDRAEPDGYPEVAAPWISGGTLAERLRFTQAFLIAKGQSNRSDAGNSYCDPVALLKMKLASADWSDPGAIADYFLALLYPAEGKANLALYRASALNFLNLSDDGVTPSSFSSLSPTSTTYDTRVRGMVAMLMTFQRFQEQ
jgi:uncharacterized protein (DUF1800 family)